MVCVSNMDGTMMPTVAVCPLAASNVTGLKMEQIAKGDVPFPIICIFVFFLAVCFPWFDAFFLS